MFDAVPNSSANILATRDIWSFGGIINEIMLVPFLQVEQSQIKVYIVSSNWGGHSSNLSEEPQRTNKNLPSSSLQAFDQLLDLPAFNILVRCLLSSSRGHLPSAQRQGQNQHSVPHKQTWSPARKSNVANWSKAISFNKCPLCYPTLHAGYTMTFCPKSVKPFTCASATLHITMKGPATCWLRLHESAVIRTVITLARAK